MSVVPISITRSNGRIFVRFKDKHEYDFASIESMRAWTRASTIDDREREHKLCMERALALSADLSNTTQVVNQRFSYDPGSLTPIVVVPDL